MTKHDLYDFLYHYKPNISEEKNPETNSNSSEENLSELKRIANEVTIESLNTNLSELKRLISVLPEKKPQTKQELFNEFKHNILEKINKTDINYKDKNYVEKIIRVQLIVIILQIKMIQKAKNLQPDNNISKDQLSELNFKVNQKTRAHISTEDNKFIKALHSIFNETSSFFFELGMLLPVLHSIDNYFIQYQDNDHSWNPRGATLNLWGHFTHMTIAAQTIYCSLVGLGITSKLTNHFVKKYFAVEREKNENANAVVDHIDTFDEKFSAIYEEILRFCVEYNNQCSKRKTSIDDKSRDGSSSKSNAYDNVDDTSNNLEKISLLMENEELKKLDNKIDDIFNKNWPLLDEKSNTPKEVVEILNAVFIKTGEALGV